MFALPPIRFQQRCPVLKKKTDEVVSHFGKSRLLSLPFVFVARFVNNNTAGKLKVRKENTCPPAPHSSCTPSEGHFHSPCTPSVGHFHSPCTPSGGHVPSEGDFHNSMYRLSHYKSVLSGAIASHFVHKLAFFGD